MRQADKDIYFDDIEIEPVDQEQLKEIVFLLLEREVKDEHRRFIQK